MLTRGIKLYFDAHALISLISTVEELSQPTKNANKILVSIFMAMKATILDTHGIIQKIPNRTNKYFVCRDKDPSLTN